MRRVILRPGYVSGEGRPVGILDTASAAIAHAQGVPGPVPLLWESHDLLTGERVGEVHELAVDDSGALWADLEPWAPISEDVAVSPSILINFEDAAGRPWPAVIDHVALTRSPADLAQLAEGWIS